MSLEVDEEILQDFLIEAGEILEEMSEQLVSLENDPENMDLLNGIFRGFHTVKGGSGFLSLNPMVEICHVTENIFDVLRKGERVADAELMDNILTALDVLNDMFEIVKGGAYPESADPEFIELLGTYTKPVGDSPDDEEDVEEEVVEDEIEENVADNQSSETIGDDEITDDEFDALLDELHGQGKFSVDKLPEEKSASASKKDKAAPGASDEITDDEFDALLDELHGKGKFSVEAGNDKAEEKTKSKKKKASKKVEAPASTDDEITDDEFDALLDELHGAGKGPTKSSEKPLEAKESGKPANKSDSDKKDEQKAKAEPVKAEQKKSAPKPAAKSAEKNVPAKKAAVPAETTLRVDTKKLDDIMNMVGELVLVRNRLKTLGQATHDEDLSKAISNLDIVTADLQGSVMKTRMQPIKKVFGRFPRVVRDLARSLKKQIKLELVGEETDLDKNLVEALADPLVHLVRNSVDHGIELPADRIKAGKDPEGTVVLSASQEGDHIVLAIEDDGKGMNADVLRNIAIDKGLMDKEQADRLTDTECYNLIFMAGFSTKQEISDISGRGVGMDVVKTKITQLNGSITVESILGQGSKILIKVPLTLAILPTLMVKIKSQSFALPLATVNEIFNLDMHKTNTVDGKLVVIVREKAIPLFFLNEWLAAQYVPPGETRDGYVVLVQVGTQRVGFVVDSLIGQEEVVIKALGKSLHGTPGMAGATITSDGGIALIIDVPSLLKYYAR